MSKLAVYLYNFNKMYVTVILLNQEMFSKISFFLCVVPKIE